MRLKKWKGTCQITRYAIRYLKELKKKYGKDKQRKTEISRTEDGELVPFDKIVFPVVAANETFISTERMVLPVLH